MIMILINVVTMTILFRLGTKSIMATNDNHLISVLISTFNCLVMNGPDLIDYM